MIEIKQSEILQELARRDIKYFVKYTHKNYIFSKFNIEIMEALNQFLLDVNEEKRPILIIQAPPQHGKSELASRKFPAFAFGRNPNYRIAGCSYGFDLATTINRDIQNLMISEEYGELFPNSSLNKKFIKDEDARILRNSDKFNLYNHKGYYICTGVGGALTGKSVDIGIIDDPIKNMQEARSLTVRESLKSWYQSVFLTRLSKKSGQLIMATRWAVDDLIGYIIDINKNTDNIKILKFSAVDENNNVLIPKLHPLEQLMDYKKGMATPIWEALYQQNPIVVGGNIIKSEWFREYSILPKLEQIYITCDTALKTGQQNDFSVLQLWGKEKFEYGYNYYLIDQIRGKWEAPDLESNTLCFYEKAKQYKCNCLYIEDKASGTGLIQFLKRKKINVSAVNPNKDKYLRLSEVLPTIANGRVYIPSIASWKLDFLSECENFTQDNSHAHDDQVDCLSMALNDEIIKFNSLKSIL